MIKEYAADIADQMGINLTSVSTIECYSTSTQAAFLLIFSACGHSVNTLVYKSELDTYLESSSTNLLDKKIRVALQELKKLCDRNPLL